ncbi:MAG TPA: hypothetical protein VFS20_18685 [Longimicrobium sp.]|nr:hypothetical protein [Longimicrobium sp.]
MRPQSLLARVFPLAALAVAAACDSDGGTNPRPRLTPADVQGVYNICSLRFTPVQNALPSANLLQFVVHPSPPAPKQPPSLTLSGQTATYQLLYTRRSDNFTQDLRSNVALGVDELILSVPDEASSEVRRELLLPGQMLLHFSDNPRRLTAVGEMGYNVRRADYARAAGITEEGLQDKIAGSLTGVFAVGNCP